MTKANRRPIKLPVNRLMWDSLAIKADEYENPAHVCYAGSKDALVAKVTLAHYHGLLDYAYNTQNISSSISLQQLIRRTANVKP